MNEALVGLKGNLTVPLHYGQMNKNNFFGSFKRMFKAHETTVMGRQLLLSTHHHKLRQ